MVAASTRTRRESELPRRNGAAASHGLHEQKVSAAFRGQQLAAVPSDLLTLKNLVHIDLSRNQITRFPGALVAAEMLRLEVVLLQDNLLYVLEDVLALASAPRLCELNLLNNPLRLQNNRVYLLEALLSQLGSDESLLVMAHKDEQLKLYGDDSSAGARTAASSAAALHRGKSHHHRRRHSAIAMTYRKKLPRKLGLPMLMKLNGDWITDREIKDVEDECGHAIEYFAPRASKPLSHHQRLASETSSVATATAAGADRDLCYATSKTEPIKTKSARPESAASEALAAGRTDHRRFDGSRMTIKQMLRNEARSAAVPAARVIQRFCIDADTGNEVAELESDGARDCTRPHQRASSSGSLVSATSSGMATAVSASPDEHDQSELSDRAEEQAIIHRLFQSSSDSSHRNLLRTAPSSASGRRVSETPACDDARSSSSHATDSVIDDGMEDDELVEPWNYPISTFDALGSEDRQYVRARSKQSGSTLERDDHFFASGVFLDCVAQAERSRRLTVRAVDLLSQQQQPQQVSRLEPSQSTPALPMCTAAATLVDSMNAKFSKHLDQATYEKVLAFQAKHLSVDSLNIQAAVGDYYQSEHVLQKQRTNQLLSAVHATAASTDRHVLATTTAAIAAAAAAEASIEDSLSKLKLRNAVDLANTLMDPKQQKRMLQTLIDADTQVIEEERVAQEQTAHRFRLALIHARRYTPSDAKQIDALVRKVTNTSASPWQRRNWKAVEVQRASALEATQIASSAMSSPCAQPTPADSLGNGTSASTHDLRFRSIESVERAAQDPLAGVNSHDLLVRCSEIRPHADKHVKALAQYRDRFLNEEAAWERMRQDPTNVVRRQLKRRLYRHAQDVQIGSTHVVHSSLFH